MANGSTIQGVALATAGSGENQRVVVRTADNSGYYIKDDNPNGVFYGLYLKENERVAGSSPWVEATYADNLTILVDESNGGSEDEHAVDNFNNLLRLGLDPLVFVRVS